MIGNSAFTKFLLWFSLAVTVGSYICAPIADPDLWWHIVVGRWILAHRQIPTVDYWNMFSSAAEWRAYSWSNEVVLALIDREWGMKGLVVSQLLLAITLTASLQFFVGRLARDHFFGAFFGMYVAAACYNHFTLRPQSVVWILFAGAIVLADEIVERGLSKRRLALLAATGCFWANTHLTAALGLVAVFLWTIQSADARLRFQLALKSSAAFFLGTLCTPYVGGEWFTLFEKTGHPLKYQSIAEFQPATILQYSAVFVVLLVFVLLVVSYTTRNLPTIARGLLALAMLFAGLTAVKFLPFAGIAWVSLFGVWWRQITDCP